MHQALIQHWLTTKMGNLKIALLTGLMFIMSSSYSYAAGEIASLYQLINQKKWVQAEEAAGKLDQSIGHGDILAAFTKAVELYDKGNFADSLKLSSAVLQRYPTFTQALELTAANYIRLNDPDSAAKLFRNYANSLNDGLERDKYIQRAEKLEPDMSPRLSFDVGFYPSTNLNRQTKENQVSTDIGTLNTSDNSKGKAGITASLVARVTKPLFRTQHTLNSASLELGGTYDSLTKTIYPTLGARWRTDFLFSKKTTYYIEPFAQHIWQVGKPFSYQLGVNAGLSHSFSPTLLFGLSVSVSHLNYKQNIRDAYEYQANVNVVKRLSPSDKLVATSSFTHHNARSDVLSYNNILGDIDWEHRFNNGIISSLGGSINHRQYLAPSPGLTGDDNQKRTTAKLRIGLSHEKLMYKSIRPEVTYTYIKQWSNNQFFAYDANDFGVRFKGNF